MKRLLAICVMAAWVGSSALAAPLTWSTAYDQTAATTSATQQLRSVAASDGSVYMGFIQHHTPGSRDVYRLDMNNPPTILDTRGQSVAQPKGVAVDDRGYVYVGNREGSGSFAAIIQVHPADLGTPVATLNASTSEFGGVAIHKSGGSYHLYIAREASGHINRYDVTDLNNITLDTSFGTGGTFAVPGGNKLRGLTVADDGTIFVADRDNNAVFRISPDLSTTTSATVTRAMDVALFGGNVYATSYNGVSSLVRVLDMNTMALVEDIVITTLDGNPYSRGSSEGFSGIDIDSQGRIWLADQAYQSSGLVQDRLLVSSAIPEPATLGLLALGGMALLRRRRAA
jgi:streptogramin lyase